MTTPQSLTDACRTLFGAHPEDVIAPLETATDTLAWLEEILGIIAKTAHTMHAPDAPRIRNLAEAGRYLASDLGNCIGCNHESMRDHLRAAGIPLAEQPRGQP